MTLTLTCLYFSMGCGGAEPKPDEPEDKSAPLPMEQLGAIVPIGNTAFSPGEVKESPQCLKFMTRGLPKMEQCPPSVRGLFQYTTREENGSTVKDLMVNVEEAERYAWGVALLAGSISPPGVTIDSSILYAHETIIKETINYSWLDTLTPADATSLASLCNDNLQALPDAIVNRVLVGCSISFVDGEAAVSAPTVTLKGLASRGHKNGEGKFRSDNPTGPRPTSLDCTEKVVVQVEFVRREDICLRFVLPTYSKALQEQKKTLLEQAKSLQENISDLTQGADHLAEVLKVKEKEVKELSKALEKSQRSNDKLMERLDHLMQQLSVTGESNAELQTEMAELVRQLQENQEQVQKMREEMELMLRKFPASTTNLPASAPTSAASGSAGGGA